MCLHLLPTVNQTLHHASTYHFRKCSHIHCPIWFLILTKGEITYPRTEVFCFQSPNTFPQTTAEWAEVTLGVTSNTNYFQSPHSDSRCPGIPFWHNLHRNDMFTNFDIHSLIKTSHLSRSHSVLLDDCPTRWISRDFQIDNGLICLPLKRCLNNYQQPPMS